MSQSSSAATGKQFPHDSFEECIAAECGTCAPNPPAAPVRSEREQVLEAFYDSITGILFLHDQGNLGHTSVLGEVRHSTQRCEEQLAEIEDAEVRALSEEDDHAVA